MFARPIGLGHLANGLCRSCGDEEDDNILQLLFTCTELGRRRKWHLDAYQMEDLNERLCLDIGSLSEKLRVVPRTGDNMKLWYHNGPCARPKYVPSDCIVETAPSTYLSFYVLTSKF